MNAQSLHDFFAMGGYAAYVWPAYAVFFGVLLMDALAPYWRRRHILRELQARLVRQTARHHERAAPAANDDTFPPASPSR